MHLSNRQIFLQHVAQTSPSPIGLEIVKAEGVYLHASDEKRYIDFISGNSVSNIGHCHPNVVKAVQQQAERYMFLMVYGEYIMSPQIQLAEALAKSLPSTLNSTYFVNSGAEAVEGALKLAKRLTHRTEIVCFKDAYHGSTHGALSVMGNEYYKQAFRPLLPDVKILDYNQIDHLDQHITKKTAAVILEPIASEVGYEPASPEFLKTIRQLCSEHQAMMILDEIQSGFGRSGTMYAFEQYGIVPDILCLAKGMGGGMPIGCFISSTDNMNSFTNHPVLGHITTFGGHPVSCAASLACLQVIQYEKVVESVFEKEKWIRSLLVHPKIKRIKGQGLMLSVEFESEEMNFKIINRCIENGLVVDWFLFNSNAMRVTPPLTISIDEIKEACRLILKSIEEV